MNFLDITIIEIGQYIITLGGAFFILGFLASLYFNIHQMRRYKDQINWKIKMANAEILVCLKAPIMGGSIPERDTIISLIKTRSKNYKLKESRLINIEDIVDEIINYLYEQQNLDLIDRDKIIKLLREKTAIPAEKTKKENKLKKWFASKISNIFKKKKRKKKKKEIKKLQFFVKPEKERHKKAKKLEFSDDFEEFSGWFDYKNGIVKRSEDIQHSGMHCLKKDKNSDPHGGYKNFKKHFGFEEIQEIIFTGWINRPSVISNGLADRLALENASFCGYGFCVNHSNNTVWIERRDNAKPTIISPIFNLVSPKDEWYQFEFYLKKEGRFTLLIFDDRGGLLTTLSSFTDNKYLFFTQVVVHGGSPYYIDDLKIETL